MLKRQQERVSRSLLKHQTEKRSQTHNVAERKRKKRVSLALRRCCCMMHQLLSPSSLCLRLPVRFECCCCVFQCW
ncbi:hypothetical protein JHK85_029138 [Glycine max]|uniref:Uncharacterized protein n=2 Tax=Glycine subgen. Soja TaxID=1462606 RepID=K7LK17_SOYBN|nr:hypothetical protein JHK85_029138 [Glycine max]KAH1138797.1 hypothetical protein GYH30_028318 [Glycine max]KHN30526.1 hypothetical protein glysoja_029963 [Glycine soja]